MLHSLEKEGWQPLRLTGWFFAGIARTVPEREAFRVVAPPTRRLSGERPARR
jgi:hypothetical protein